MMTSDQVRDFFTQNASLYHRLYIDVLRYGRAVNAFLRQSGTLEPNLRILDAGCGTGNVTREVLDLARRQDITGLSIDGFDLTPAMLNRFRQWLSREGVEAIDLREANVLELHRLPESWSGYDRILSSAMLEYLPKDRLAEALAALRRRLASDGTLTIFITRRNLLMKGLIEWWWKANIYTRDELREIYREAGFDSITFRRFPWPFWYVNLWGLIVEARPRR
ncbi:MAG: methyltransferase domain-containing protein, partial [Deltaproteobacteria bacterium]|nr:methyltransferase domain-containing protein [Deltaproteobacteria bacterium]